MEEKDIFYIEKNGMKYKANIITNFELYGYSYCAYAVEDHQSKNYNVYCAKIVNDHLIPIMDEKEIQLTNNLITELIKGKKNEGEE